MIYAIVMRNRNLSTMMALAFMRACGIEHRDLPRDVEPPDPHEEARRLMMQRTGALDRAGKPCR